MNTKTACLITLLFTLTACGKPENTANTNPEPTTPEPTSKTLTGGKVLRKSNGAEPQTLDPHKAQGVTASNILRDLYESLVSEAPDGSLIPGAAQMWEVSADGLTYTFFMRKNAQWSNGDPVTANDWVFSLRRAVNPATGSDYAMILAPISNAAAIIKGEKKPAELGVSAPDSHTLKIQLATPTPYFLGLLTHATAYAVHPASVQQHGEQFTRPGKLISNGAYQMQEWVVQSHITLKRNPRYWDNANTQIETVQYWAIDDAEAALSRYRAGELDWLDSVPINRCAWVKKNLAEELHIHPYLGTYYYGINLRKKPFDDLRVRQALSMAVDRTILTEKITRCGEIPAYGWTPPGINNYTPQQADYAQWSQSKRNETALELLREAGFSKDKPLKLQVLYNTSEGHKKIAQALAAMWKQTLGIEVELLNQEWKVYLDSRKNPHTTELFRAGWIGDYNDANTFLEIFLSNHGMNDAGFKDATFDQYTNKAATETDPQKRRQLMQAAERRLLEQHAIIPLYHYVNKTVLKPWVSGYQGNIMDHHHTKNLQIITE